MHRVQIGSRLLCTPRHAIDIDKVKFRGLRGLLEKARCCVPQGKEIGGNEPKRGCSWLNEMKILGTD